MLNIETVDEFVARGGVVQRCKTYGIKKHSSIPGWHGHMKSGLGKSSFSKNKTGISPQALLDAAAGTEHEKETIKFLESQGYEVK